MIPFPDPLAGGVLADQTKPIVERWCSGVIAGSPNPCPALLHFQHSQLLSENNLP
jgi:hypothetical protein